MVRRNNNNRRPRATPSNNRKRRAMPVAHEDNVIVRRQFMNNYTVSLNNLLTTSDSNYGNTFLSWVGGNVPLEYRTQFRRYRLSRVQVYAMITQSPLGASQTIADQDTTIVTTCVNTSNATTLSSTAIRDVPGARTVSLTKGLKLISDFAPKIGMTSTPYLIYSNNQWLSTGDVTTPWRGINVNVQNLCGGSVYTDPAKMQKIYLLVREHWSFQGRISPQHTNSLTVAPMQEETLAAEAIYENTPFDLTISPDNLRTALLTGVYHPYISNGLNFGNIGGSITPAQLVGMEFRINSNPDTRYVIVDATAGFVYCNIVD